MSSTGDVNYGRFADTEVDAVMAEAKRTADLDRRLALLRRAEAAALALDPVVPLYAVTIRSLVNPRITGWRTNAPQHPPGPLPSTSDGEPLPAKAPGLRTGHALGGRHRDVLPGAPGPREAPFDGERRLPPDVEANLRAAYDLDQPVVVQYGRYIARLARGDLGPSFRQKDFSVNELIAMGLPISVGVGLTALAPRAAVGSRRRGRSPPSSGTDPATACWSWERL